MADRFTMHTTWAVELREAASLIEQLGVAPLDVSVQIDWQTGGQKTRILLSWTDFTKVAGELEVESCRKLDHADRTRVAAMWGASVELFAHAPFVTDVTTTTVADLVGKEA